ncbi:MAG: hypothetical protein JWO43_113 [Candidatus Adlerbacteria bacterium]|nr:hypothetical protein [Candidatus Adlerbacteria bacterium]
MTHFNEKMQHELRNVRLSDQEKRAIRTRLFDVMNPPAVVTPYVFMSRISLAFSAIVLLLLGSGGYTAYAAQGALPGDTLYPVKVSVNETVEGALAFSTPAKAQWHATVAERRVAEAETLASKGKLSTAAAAQISANLDDHAEQAQALTVVIAVTDPGTATQISTELSSVLDAHEQVLAELSDTSTSTETKANSSKLAVTLRTYSNVLAAISSSTSTVRTGPVVALGAQNKQNNKNAKQAATFAPAVATSAQATGEATTSDTARTMMMAAPADDTATASEDVSLEEQHATDTNMRTAIKLQASATTQLKAARTSFAKLKPTLSTTTVASITAKFAVMDQQIASSSAAIVSKDYEAAIKGFTVVLRTSTYISTYLSVGKQLTPAIVSPILEKQSSGDSSDTDNSGSGKGVVNSVIQNILGH